MQTGGTETNVPLVVGTVFAFTFLVVGAIAYLILFRRSPHDAESAEPARSVSPRPAVTVVGEIPADSTQITLPLEQVGPSVPSFTVSTVAGSAPLAEPVQTETPYDSRRTFIPLYRALMFATGVAGLLASTLMFSAVEGVSLLLFIALAIAAFSIYSVYRGFALEPELRQPRR